MNIFDPDSVACFTEVFSALARQGIGPTRGRAVMERTEGALQRLSLEPPPNPVTRIRIEFLTPTELKSGDHVVMRPEFPALFGRIRDRISTLRASTAPVH